VEEEEEDEEGEGEGEAVTAVAGRGGEDVQSRSRPISWKKRRLWGSKN
jgi:hypothetical protein